MALSTGMGEVVSMTSRDTAAIVEWQNATGTRKTLLLNELFRTKAGLIRQLTQKAARAEKTSEDYEDLYQAGAIGFHKAIERFDASRGYAISTYAAWWIRHEVQRVARSANLIALPRIRLTNEERQRVLAALRENPDVAAEELGIRAAQLEQVRNSYGIRIRSAGTEDSEARSNLIDRAYFADLRGGSRLKRAGASAFGESTDEPAPRSAPASIRRAMTIIVANPSATARELGCAEEQRENVVRCLHRMREKEIIIMSEIQETGAGYVNGSGPAAAPTGRPKRGRKPKAVAAAPRKPGRPRKQAAAPAPVLSLRDLAREALSQRLAALSIEELIKLAA